MEPEENTAPYQSKAFDLLAAGNVPAAVATITAIAGTEAAIEALAHLCRRACRDLMSVPAITALAWEAIAFGLQCATAAPDPESAARYKGRCSYNAAANCWPGWGDAVEIQSADIAQGPQLAERSFELAGELNLGHKAIGTSHWLVGALHMAAGRLSTAIAQFRRAEEAFQAAQLPVQAAMARGYVALAEQALPESQLEGAKSLAAALTSLRNMESREAHFFSDQLLTAGRIFPPR